MLCSPYSEVHRKCWMDFFGNISRFASSIYYHIEGKYDTEANTYILENETFPPYQPKPFGIKWVETVERPKPDMVI
jgi:hypothetical protein